MFSQPQELQEHRIRIVAYSNIDVRMRTMRNYFETSLTLECFIFILMLTNLTVHSSFI